MPSHTLPVLGYAAAFLFACYLGLMVTTVSMASWQTTLSVQVREAEGEIARLEARYYDRVTVLDRTDPASVGLVPPTRVTYAPEAAAPAVTRR